AGQMAASDYVPIFFKNRLHLAGRPQMSTRPSQPCISTKRNSQLHRPLVAAVGRWRRFGMAGSRLLLPDSEQKADMPACPKSAKSRSDQPSAIGRLGPKGGTRKAGRLPLGGGLLSARMHFLFRRNVRGASNEQTEKGRIETRSAAAAG